MATHKNDPRELELGDPKLLKIVNNQRIWQDAGDSILFTEKDILRIVLLKH